MFCYWLLVPIFYILKSAASDDNSRPRIRCQFFKADVNLAAIPIKPFLMILLSAMLIIKLIIQLECTANFYDGEHITHPGTGGDREDAG